MSSGIPLGLQPLSDINPTPGFISQAVIAETDKYGFGADRDFSSILSGTKPDAAYKIRDTTMAADRGFHPVQLLMSDIGIMDEGENIPIPYYTGDASDTKDASGPTTIGGSAMVAASGDGDELLLANLTQALNPTHNKRTGEGVGSGTVGNKVDLVAEVDLETTSTPTSHTVVSSVTIDNPTRVRIEFTTAARVTAGQVGLIEITGTCLDGSGKTDKYEDVTEQFTITTDGDVRPTDVNSQVFFKTVTAVKSSNFKAGKFKVTVQDTAEVVKFNGQDNKLTRFWVIEIAKGIFLNLYTGVITTGMSFDFDRGSPIVYDVGFTGRSAFLNEDINGRKGAAAKKLGPATAANSPRLQIATTEVLTGWQCELRLNGVPAAITAATFNMQQNLTPTGAISGERPEAVKPVRSVRNSTIDMTVIYAPENDFARLFRNNITMRAELIIKHAPYGGFPWRKAFIFPQAQVNANVDAEAGEGLMTQDIGIKAFTSGIGLATPDDVEIICDYSKYHPVLPIAA